MALKRISASATIGSIEYLIKNTARWEIDDWERRWQLQTEISKMQALAVEKMKYERDLAEGSNDPKFITAEIEKYNKLIEEVQQSMIKDVTIKKPKKSKLVDKDYPEQIIVSRTLAAKANLLSLTIAKPKRSTYEWLCEDATLFDKLSRAVEHFIFEYGQEEVDFKTALITHLNSLSPDEPMTVKGFIEIVESAYNESANASKKKSESALNVQIERV